MTNFIKKNTISRIGRTVIEHCSDAFLIVAVPISFAHNVYNGFVGGVRTRNVSEQGAIMDRPIVYRSVFNGSRRSSGSVPCARRTTNDRIRIPGARKKTGHRSLGPRRSVDRERLGRRSLRPRSYPPRAVRSPRAIFLTDKKGWHRGSPGYFFPPFFLFRWARARARALWLAPCVRRSRTREGGGGGGGGLMKRKKTRLYVCVCIRRVYTLPSVLYFFFFFTRIVYVRCTQPPPPPIVQ